MQDLIKLEQFEIEVLERLKDGRFLDAENKFYTMLFEIKSKNYPRSLKIEIRKRG